jgi:hypothetical protein
VSGFSQPARALTVMLAVLIAWAGWAAAPEQALPATVDLSPAFAQWGLGPRRQGARPTCSAFTVAAALEYAVASRQGQGTRLSVEFLNWASNQACDDKEDGGFFSDLWKGFEHFGICTDSALPYAAKFDLALVPPAAALADAKTRLDLGLRFHWIKEWNVNTGLKDAEFAGIKETLNAGWPVCGGFRWPKREQWENEVLQMCPSNAVRDGHSVLLVGYRDDAAQPGGGVFIFRNTSRGGQPGLMPYAYARTYMNDAAWIDHATRTGSTRTPSASSPAPAGDRPGARLTLPDAGRRRLVSGNEPPHSAGRSHHVSAFHPAD